MQVKTFLRACKKEFNRRRWDVKMEWSQYSNFGKMKMTRKFRTKETTGWIFKKTKWVTKFNYAWISEEMIYDMEESKTMIKYICKMLKGGSNGKRYN